MTATRQLDPLRVAFVAAEAFPFAKIGGLADVIGALPMSLAELGVEVTVYVPWYKGIAATPTLSVAYDFAGVRQEAAVGEVLRHGVRFCFIRVDGFEQHSAYGSAGEVTAFVRFCLATAPLIDADVVHLHDWQVALLAALVRAGKVRARRSVFTVHNLAYQGFARADELARQTGLAPAALGALSQDPAESVCLTRAGLLFGDRITTVSPTYAREILTPAFGAGLDGVLRERKSALVGIRNGIDTEVWNPATDDALPAHYTSARAPGKQACVDGLRQELGLEGPVLGVVSRLAAQKGIDIVRRALPEIMRLGYSVAVLGTGEPDLERDLAETAKRMPARLHFHCGFDEARAHRIYAGSTAMLMPSRFEPCGLTQLIAQRYGTPPVARSVGGLSDTIEHGRTGILYEDDNESGLLAGIVRLRLHPDAKALAEAGMARDWSWTAPAARYLSLYQELHEVPCPV